jgi:formate hydrogenlyase subunit 6/NADH:ubiquinone oxidoreductase subunit I
VSALRMQDDIPVVDPAICIACFCCQEICPEKAMTLT